MTDFIEKLNNRKIKRKFLFYMKIGLILVQKEFKKAIINEKF